MKYKIKKRPLRILKDKNKQPFIKFKGYNVSLKGYNIKQIIKIINRLSKDIKKKKLDPQELKQKRDKINKFISGAITSTISGGQQQIVESRLKEDTEKIKELSNEIQLYKTAFITNKNKIKNNNNDMKSIKNDIDNNEEKKEKIIKERNNIENELKKINDRMDDYKLTKKKIKEMLYYDKNSKKYILKIGIDEIPGDTIDEIQEIIYEKYSKLKIREQKLNEEKELLKENEIILNNELLKQIRKEEELENDKIFLKKKNDEIKEEINKITLEKMKLDKDIRELEKNNRQLNFDKKNLEDDKIKLLKQKKEFDELYLFKQKEFEEESKKKEEELTKKEQELLLSKKKIKSKSKELKFQKESQDFDNFKMTREREISKLRKQDLIENIKTNILNIFGNTNKGTEEKDIYKYYNDLYDDNKKSTSEISKQELEKILLKFEIDNYIFEIERKKELKKQKSQQIQSKEESQQIEEKPKKNDDEDLFAQFDENPFILKNDDNEGNGFKKGGLWTNQINKIMEPFKLYITTISIKDIDKIIDYIKTNKLLRGGFIMNDKEHWVAIYYDISPHGEYQLCYYDPYGNKPSSPYLMDKFKKLFEEMEVDSYVKTKINATKEQSITSNNCGWFCIRFLLEMFNNIDFKTATRYQKISKNEKEIKELKDHYNKFGFI